MTTFGNLMLAVAWLGAFASFASLIMGDRMGVKDGEPLTNVGYIATFVIAAAVTLSVLVLLVGFFTNAFTMQYVAENHSTDVSSLAWLYKSRVCGPGVRARCCSGAGCSASSPASSRGSAWRSQTASATSRWRSPTSCSCSS